MADRLGVMHAGRMEQVGTPREIFETPVNRFVAAFMGVENLWNGMVREDGLAMEAPELAMPVRLAAKAAAGPAVLGVRAERMIVGTLPDMTHVSGVSEGTTYAGETVMHSVRLGNGTIVLVSEPAHSAAAPENGVMTLSIPPSACIVLPP